MQLIKYITGDITMITLRQFVEQVNINLTNLFQHLDAVTYCATHEGAYCDEFSGINENGAKEFSAIPFLETEIPVWDRIRFDGKYYTQEEFTGVVLNYLSELIANGALDEEDEDEDEGEKDLYEFLGGLGIRWD